MVYEKPHSRPLRVLEWGTLVAIVLKKSGYLGRPPERSERNQGRILMSDLNW